MLPDAAMLHRTCSCLDSATVSVDWAACAIVAWQSASRWARVGPGLAGGTITVVVVAEDELALVELAVVLVELVVWKVLVCELVACGLPPPCRRERWRRGRWRAVAVDEVVVDALDAGDEEAVAELAVCAALLVTVWEESAVLAAPPPPHADARTAPASIATGISSLRRGVTAPSLPHAAHRGAV